MKKLSFLLVFLLMIAGVSHAQTTVSSANVMGYKKVLTPPESVYKMVALTQFSDGSTNTLQAINDLIANLDDLNSDGLGSNAVGADKLHVYTGIGYNSYALFQPAAGDPYWASVNEGGWTPGLEFLGVAATADTLARGAAVWYETASSQISTNLLTAGDVYLDDTFDLTVPEGYSLLSYPYSSDITLDTLVISNAASSGLGSATAGADKLHVYTGIGYNSYALFQPAAGDPYWASVNEGGWTPGLEFLGVNPATDITISLGTGLWFETAAEPSKTIGFTKIYTID